MINRRKQMAVALAAIGVAVFGVGQAAAARVEPTRRRHGHYNPHIDPADFVRKIDNRYLPFKPGTSVALQGRRRGREDAAARRRGRHRSDRRRSWGSSARWSATR